MLYSNYPFPKNGKNLFKCRLKSLLSNYTSKNWPSKADISVSYPILWDGVPSKFFPTGPQRLGRGKEIRGKQKEDLKRKLPVMAVWW